MADMFRNKVVLVTGASTGLGHAFAKSLLERGMIVYCAARRVEKMKDLESAGATSLKMDVTRQEDIDAAITIIEEQQGRVDVLINNAGFGMYGSVEDISLGDARYQFEVNIFGLAAVTKAVLPHMRKQRSGRIINISSMGGKVYTPLGAWYHATKHALEGWSDCLRVELKQFGIDVIIVEPGAIRTGFGEIMSNRMKTASGEGDYADLAGKVQRTTEQFYKKGIGSEPKVIVDLINKAIRATRPKTRYVGGKYARLTMFLRKWFGDRIYDKMLSTMLK